MYFIEHQQLNPTAGIRLHMQIRPCACLLRVLKERHSVYMIRLVLLLCTDHPNISITGPLTVLTTLSAMPPNIIQIIKAVLMLILKTLNASIKHNFFSLYTPTKGHILDLFCCSGIKPYNTASELPLSEHNAVLFNTSQPLSISRAHRTIPFSEFRHVNLV